MKASVVIPTYKRPGELKNLLLSLNEQTCPSTDFEIIVVDNGGDDETKRIIESVSLAPRLTYILEGVKGAARARNLGIQKVQTEIVIFVDDDMTVDAHFIEEHLRAHSKSDKDVCVLGKIIHKPHNENKIVSNYISQSAHQNILLPDVEGQELDYRCFYTANISVSKKALKKVGNFDESFPYYGWEDTDIGYRLQQSGIPIIYNPYAVGYHHFDTSLKAYFKKRYLSGKSLGYFLSKHPELISEMHIANVPFLIIILKFIGALIVAPFGRLVFAFTPRLLFRALDAIGNFFLFLGLKSVRKQFGLKEYNAGNFCHHS